MRNSSLTRILLLICDPSWLYKTVVGEDWPCARHVGILASSREGHGRVPPPQTVVRTNRPPARGASFAALSGEALATLRHRAEEALANGVARTRLGYKVLVKLTMDEFLLEARHDGRGALNRQAREIQPKGREAAHHGGVDQFPDA